MLTIGLVMSLIMLASFVFVKQDYDYDKREAQIQSFGEELQQELILASEVHTGYNRQITIPETIGVFEYTINQTDRLMMIISEGIVHPFSIPKINGNITKGTLTIRNIGGEVFVS